MNARRQAVKVVLRGRALRPILAVILYRTDGLK